MRIFLLTGLLHTDIAIPVSDRVLARFPELADTRLPLDHPGLRHFGFGWGSRAFYTTAGTYADITLSAAWKAATGDASVMRVTALPALSPSDDTLAIELSRRHFDSLLDAIAAGFARDGGDRALYLPQYSIGSGDAFFASGAHFDLLRPCNEWTADMLNAAGIATGRWTPMTWSLALSLQWHGGM